MDEANGLFIKDKEEKDELEKLINNTKVPTFNKIYELQDKKNKEKESSVPAKKSSKKIPDFSDF
jgi:cytochrome c1